MYKVRNILATATLSFMIIGVGSSGLASAAPGYSLFGDSEVVSPGHNSDTALQVRSDDDPGWGSVEYEFPAGTTLADIDVLSTDFKITEGDCGGGSPRFQLETASGNIFIYFGPYPNYTSCVAGNWENTGDLLSEGMYLDTTQIGGAFYQPYEDAITDYGTTVITKISLVTDAGWAVEGGVQTTLVDNTIIGNTPYDYEPDLTYPTAKEECKKNGWKSFSGVSFKNQGDCVSYVATGGNNMPAGSALVSDSLTF